MHFLLDHIFCALKRGLQYVNMKRSRLFLVVFCAVYSVGLAISGAKVQCWSSIDRALVEVQFVSQQRGMMVFFLFDDETMTACT